MKRTVLFLIALTVLVVSSSAFAATATAPLAISANVAANCTITTSAVAFGAYDPLVANATAATPLDAAGAVNVACTRGATGLRIDLNTGSNPLAGARRMNLGVTEFLTYELYTDPTRTTVWGSGAVAGLAIADAPSKAVRSFPVYGRVPGAQDPAIGAYGDTVTATINF